MLITHIRDNPFFLELFQFLSILITTTCEVLQNLNEVFHLKKLQLGYSIC